MYCAKFGSNAKVVFGHILSEDEKNYVWNRKLFNLTVLDNFWTIIGRVKRNILIVALLYCFTRYYLTGILQGVWGEYLL